ncbi:hypothetical protein [Clostridium sp. CCUG 7971]|nr:hypothetical protein [Clostridium sp. CCUG 7971]
MIKQLNEVYVGQEDAERAICVLCNSRDNDKCWICDGGKLDFND